MKKSLLMVLAIGCCSLANAQSNASHISRVGRAGMLQLPYLTPGAESNTKSTVKSTAKNTVHKNNANRTSQAQAFSKVKFATSYNLFSALTAACSQLTYNGDLGMIAYTHRECNSYFATNGSGAYETDYSLNNGSTWDTTSAIVNKNWATRYPNGVILNPVGNSTPNMAYAISSGPHNTTPAWDSIAYSSIRLDGANTMQNEVMMYPNTTAQTFNVFTAPHYMSVSEDSTVHNVAEAWSYNNTNYTAAYTFYGAVLSTGTWNGGTHSVSWAQTIIRPHFAGFDGPSDPYDSNAELSQVGMAWSQDGKVGYVVFFGNLDSVGYNYASLQPIVYKSTDHGTTWNMMPPYNFRFIPSLVKYLRPTTDSGGIKLPTWDINGDSGYYAGHDVDMTVDTNYNLHIFGAIESCPIANPDSGGYQFNPVFSGGRYIYDVYTTTPTGGWNATFIDSLTSPYGAYAIETQWSAGTIAYGARIQASRTKTGGKVFCTWTDDVNTGNNTILNPDIMTAAIDVATNKVTGPTQVTNDANNFFMFVSDIAYYNGGCWTIPCTVIGDANLSSSGTSPIAYYYVQGVCAVDGINEVGASGHAEFTVSANYPNPFGKLTQFDVNLPEAASVSVDVYNLVGQKVWNMSPEKMAPGKHTLTINGSSLNAGVYFYRVTANGQSITHKMVIE